MNLRTEFLNALSTATLQPKNMVITTEIESEIKSLEMVGAINSKTYKKFEILKSQQKQIREENQVIEKLREFETKYPKYRIIDLKSVVAIARKYNLLIGGLSWYTEEIPSESIRNIAEYQKSVLCNFDKIPKTVQNIIYARSDSFLIVAPGNFFKEDLVEVDGFLCDISKPKLTIKSVYRSNPDPIILCQIPVGGSKPYYHIVDSWDVEAEDPKVTNKIPIISGNN